MEEKGGKACAVGLMENGSEIGVIIDDVRHQTMDGPGIKTLPGLV